MILVGTFLVFAGLYIVYAHLLGGINGLPPLPEAYETEASGGSETPPPLPSDNNAEQKLHQAFGLVYDEIKSYKIKMELQSRGMVLATQNFEILSDGRLKLSPFSLALFRKSPNPDVQEINTVRSKEAILAFDRPISSLADMGNRKIIAGTLTGDDTLGGNITLVNNRHSSIPTDHISLTTPGPLYYDEAKQLIWTDAPVLVLDPHAKPRETRITGIGMDLTLKTDEPSVRGQSGGDGRPRVSARRSESPTGVEKIRLQKEVDMSLSIDPRSGFLESGTETARKKTSPTPATTGASTPEQDASILHITTRGPFVYNLTTDRARFDNQAGNPDSRVNVNRLNETQHLNDQLLCDHLEIQFRRKNTGAARGADSSAMEGGLDMESAHATGREVILHSDAEVLDAYGTDFFYDRVTHVTTLRGSPMRALKEGSEIEAPEMQLQDIKGAQQATAQGAGRLSMLDKATGKRTGTAHWTKQMVYGREGTQDALILIGDARFEDPEHHQDLRADVLKVWLEPSDAAAGAPGADHGRKPHHLEAVGRVRALAPEMRVFDTERLVVQFHDAPFVGGQLPPRLPEPGAKAGPAAITLGGPQSDNPSPSASGHGSKTTAADDSKRKKPIDVSARVINADVLRSGSKTDLEKVRCEGSVRVHQEPSSPEDRGVDIQGEMLDLTHKLDGNILIVCGDHAQVQINQLFILGPEIHIDQTSNEAWVKGTGIMRLPTKSNLDGTPLARETQLTVSWQKEMLFNGQSAQFRSGVTASQDNGHLACEAMTVNLDRKVSLREGDKGKQPARVQQLICESDKNDVWVEDKTFRDKRLVSSSRLKCPQLVLDNDSDNPGEKTDSKLNAGGPGLVRLFRLGAKNDFYGPDPGTPPARGTGPARKSTANPQSEEEFTLTAVRYEGRMYADNASGLARFYGHVLVVHVPTDNPDLPINANHPPPGYFMLRCERLEVLKLKRADGSSTQAMKAFQRVDIEGPDFSGSADVVKFDEAKDLVVLEGSPGSPAVLESQKGKGTPRNRLRGDQIYYSPKSGEAHVVHGSVIEIGR
jgi:hypothetical protein